MVQHREGRSGVVRSVIRSAVTGVLVIAVYAVLPVHDTSTVSSVIVLVVGLAVLVALVVLRLRQIQQDTRPRLRSAEVLALVVPLFVVVFAWAYLLLSASDPASFSQPLNRVGAIYFTVVITSTVGFGDISAQTDIARILVTLQIVLTFTLFTAVIKMILQAGQRPSVAETGQG
jgi:hypothetical protein